MRQVRMLIGDVVLRAELLATPTADAIWEALPVESRASTWGDEVYFQTTLDLEGEEDARTVLELGEIAFWLAGNCIAICFGPTPVSHGDEPRLASPGNVWATSLDDVGLLASVADGDAIRVEAIE